MFTTTKIFARLALGLVALACASCASQPKPPATASIQSEQDAYFVIGLAPANVRIEILESEVKNNQFNGNPFRMTDPFYSQDDGYIVVKARPGATLGIVMLQLMSSPTSLIGPSFVPCKKTLVFTAEAGKVVYITNVFFGPGRAGGLLPSYRQDLESARAYMTSHYPQLAGKLEQGRFQFLQTRGGCS